MSTMYDALRKAEMERKRASGGTVPAESGIAAHTGAMPDNIKIVLLLAAVAAVFGIALYRFMAVRDAFKPAKPAMRAANTLAPAAPAVPCLPHRRSSILRGRIRWRGLSTRGLFPWRSSTANF